jgi:hypothetical protein
MVGGHENTSAFGLACLFERATHISGAIIQQTSEIENKLALDD